MIKDGVKAAKYFSNNGIKTNVTLVFSAGQALLAAKAGATYVSPFLGRLDDISTDGLNLISEIREIYDNFNFDAVTLSPYMGGDCIKPFFRNGKWSIVLIATSNPTAEDFQMLNTENGIPLYMEVLKKAKTWGSSDDMMFVVGGTRPEIIKEIRRNAKDYFLLIPGVGHQGGDLSKIVKYGFNDKVGILVNCSRSILYAGNDDNFAEASKLEAERIQKEMAIYLT